MVVNSRTEVHALLSRSLKSLIRLRVRRWTFFVALSIFFVLPLYGQQAEPWLGNWNLNLAESGTASAPPPYKRATCRIESIQDGLKVTYDMVGVRGGVTHIEWSGKFDGKDYAVQGVDSVLTNAYRIIDDHSYEIVVKLDGAVVATSRVTVSPDGQTLRVSTGEPTASGQTRHTTSVYARM